MTYEEIKKELARLKEERDNSTTYELYYPSNGGAPYYTNVFDLNKWDAVNNKMRKLQRLPEYIEGKKAEDEKTSFVSKQKATADSLKN